MKKKRMFKSRRFWVISLIILFLFVVIIGAGSYWYYQATYDPMAHVTRTYEPVDMPVSTAAWTTYKNSSYGFTILYPSDWKTNSREYNSEEDIVFSYQVESASPDLHALDITCLTNQKHFTAQQWNEQFPDWSSNGSQTLTSGTNVFVSVQADNSMYTTVLDNKVCEIGASFANSGNRTLINKVVNSFSWQK